MSHLDFSYLFLEDFFKITLLSFLQSFLPKKNLHIEVHLLHNWMNLEKKSWFLIWISRRRHLENTKLFLLFYKNATRSSFIFHDEMKHPVSKQILSSPVKSSMSSVHKDFTKKTPSGNLFDKHSA